MSKKAKPEKSGGWSFGIDIAPNFKDLLKSGHQDIHKTAQTAIKDVGQTARTGAKVAGSTVTGVAKTAGSVVSNVGSTIGTKILLPLAIVVGGGVVIYLVVKE